METSEEPIETVEVDLALTRRSDVTDRPGTASGSEPDVFALDF
jgi:hypothetical protein